MVAGTALGDHPAYIYGSTGGTQPLQSGCLPQGRSKTSMLHHTNAMAAFQLLGRCLRCSARSHLPVCRFQVNCSLRLHTLQAGDASAAASWRSGHAGDAQCSGAMHAHRWLAAAVRRAVVGSRISRKTHVCVVLASCQTLRPRGDAARRSRGCGTPLPPLAASSKTQKRILQAQQLRCSSRCGLAR